MDPKVHVEDRDKDLNFWFRDDITEEEMASKSVFVNASDTHTLHRLINQERVHRAVELDVMDLKFTMKPQSHGLQIVDLYESIMKELERDEGYEEALEGFSGMRPEEVMSNANLRHAAEIFDELNHPDQWEPIPNTDVERMAKTRITAPVLAVLNLEMNKRVGADLSVLVVGDNPGPDLRRVVIARGACGGLRIDTFSFKDMIAQDKTFRDLVSNEYGAPPAGTPFFGGITQMREVMTSRGKYDLVVVINSLHNMLTDVVVYSEFVALLPHALGISGVLIGMIPCLDGMRTLESCNSVKLLKVDTNATSKGSPFGTMTCVVVGEIFVDSIAPVDFLVSTFATQDLVLEVMPSSSVYRTMPVPKHLGQVPAPENRAFQILIARYGASSYFPYGEIPDIDAEYSSKTLVASPNVSALLLGPRDHGNMITLDDSLYMMNVPFFCSEKTDGNGVMVGIMPGTHASGSVLMIRYGGSGSAKTITLPIVYDGPTVIAEGEMLIRPDNSWKIILFGLVRYDFNEGYSWYTGMTILSAWLSRYKTDGDFKYLGIKRWVHANATTLIDLWNRDIEGIVFKYPSAPQSVMIGGLELGTAKYLKKVLTVDLSYRIASVGTTPIILDIPDDYHNHRVAECTVDVDNNYHFVRYRDDKTFGDNKRQFERIEGAVSFSKVLEWVSCVNAGVRSKHLIYAEGSNWHRSIRGGTCCLNKQEIMQLVATGVCVLKVRMEGTTALEERQDVYRWRSLYLDRIIMGLGLEF